MTFDICIDKLTFEVSIRVCKESERCSSSSVAIARFNGLHGIGSIFPALLLPVSSSVGRNMHKMLVTGALCDSNLRSTCLLATSHTIHLPSFDPDMSKLASNDKSKDVITSLHRAAVCQISHKHLFFFTLFLLPVASKHRSSSFVLLNTDVCFLNSN